MHATGFGFGFGFGFGLGAGFGRTTVTPSSCVSMPPVGWSFALRTTMAIPMPTRTRTAAAIASRRRLDNEKRPPEVALQCARGVCPRPERRRQAPSCGAGTGGVGSGCSARTAPGSATTAAARPSAPHMIGSSKKPL